MADGSDYDQGNHCEPIQEIGELAQKLRAGEKKVLSYVFVRPLTPIEQIIQQQTGTPYGTLTYDNLPPGTLNNPDAESRIRDMLDRLER
jgi:hypothetical protein